MRKKQWMAVVAVGVAFWIGAPPALADEAAERYREAYREVLREDWQAAMTAFAELERRFPKSEWVDDARFWRCWAQEQAERDLQKAFECYAELIATHGRSEWVDDARRNLFRLSDALARQGHPEYRERVRGAERPDDRERTLAVLSALGRIGDERSVAAILEQLQGTSDEVLRAEIVYLLGEIELPEARRAVRELARSDSSERVREAALEAVAESGDAEARSMLLGLAQDQGQSPRVRAAALEGLGEVGGTGVVDVLVRIALSDPSRDVAERALQALSDFETSEAWEGAKEVLDKSRDSELREEALEVLVELDEARTEPLLLRAAKGSDPELARAAIECLGDLESRPSRAALVELYGELSDWRARVAVVHAIAEGETEASVQSLRQILAQESDARIRSETVEALAETELESAVGVLIESARSDSDPEVRAAASRALGEIGSPRAREALIQLLQGDE